MIRVRGLRKAYGPTVAVDGVDLTVEAGRIVGYIGPNGAGKTTTVRVLLGLIRDHDGEVRIDGLDPREDAVEVRRRVGYVPESPALYDALTLAEYLTLVGGLHRLEEASMRRRAEALLEALDLENRLGTRVGSLSKGMRQKLLLTAALLPAPRILLLDEPLSGLDANAAVTVKEFLDRFAAQGGAVLYCSHVLDVVERVCDPIVVLRNGRVIASGSFAELNRTGDVSLERLFTRLTADHDPAARAEAMVQALA